MLRFRDMPLNRKLTLVILLTSTTALVLGGLAMIATEFVTTRRAMVEDMTVLADLLGRNSSAALAFHREEDEEEIDKILSAVAADPHIVIVSVYDKQQKPFGGYVRGDMEGQSPPQPHVDQTRFVDGYIEVTRPIMMEEKRLGTIFLRSDLKRLYDQLGLYVAIVAIILASIIVATIVLAPRLRRPIAGPILALADVARHIAENREYSARAAKRSDDEVGLLADAFNMMLTEIQDTQSSLLEANQSMQAEIAERKQAEESLRKSEAQLQTIVENLGEGVAVFDLAGKTLQFNRVALELHGYANLDECNRHLDEFSEAFELSDLNGNVCPPDQWPLVRILRGEELKNVEMRIRNIKGNWQKIFSYGGTLVHDADGKQLMAIVTISDISGRKQAEEEIRHLNAELEQRVIERTAQLEAVINELESFSYSVSHDLRTPLRSLDGFSQALLEDCADKLDPDGKEYLRRIRGASQHMGQLIDDLLHLSRLSRMDMNREKVDLSKMAREILKELQEADNKRDAEIVIADDLTVEGDSRLLRIAMTNLLSNAWKFTSKRPNTRIEMGSEGENGHRTFYVRDNGVGFDMAYSGKLFGAFQRLHSMKEFPGTGIGLATVQRVFRRHGGRVWADSVLNEGATFHFTL